MTKQETYDYLRARGAAFEITEHKAVYNMEECADLELPYPESDAKNLFVRDDKRRSYYLITVRGDKRVDLKAFRRAHGTRSLSFASPEELQQYLHLTPGSVTPLGLLQDETRSVQFFLDEEGTGDFVCRTGRAGAQLEVTYAGAQASRPAERIEVDGFVGVKSHRAKGKRVTTFEVASLHFVEPEEPEEEPADPATGDDRSGDAPAGGPAVATGAAAANEVGAASGIELPEGPAAVPPQTDDVEFTIERPRGDQDDVIDVEQLNLF